MAYSPAANLTSSASLAHLQSIYYKKVGLDRLQKKTIFREPAMKDSIPKASGRTCQWYRYQNLSSVTTPSTEGAVGTGISLTSKVVQATVSQYTSFVNISDFLLDTIIDPGTQNAADLLGYQASLTVDVLTRTIYDNESSSTNLSLLSTYARVADLRNGRSQLQANDVLPMDDGEFYAYAHPFVTFDIVNDPAAGGLADIFKYTSPKDTPLIKYEDRGVVSHVAGARLKESTNVLITDATPDTYRMYMFGKNGVGCVDLEGRGPTNVTDPAKQPFKINVIKGQPSIVDPEGVIGAAVSYNFVYTAVVLEGPSGIGGTYRYRTWDAPSSIG